MTLPQEIIGFPQNAWWQTRQLHLICSEIKHLNGNRNWKRFNLDFDWMVSEAKHWPDSNINHCGIPPPLPSFVGWQQQQLRPDNSRYSLPQLSVYVSGFYFTSCLKLFCWSMWCLVEKKPSEMFAGNVNYLILIYALLPSSGLLHGGLAEQSKAPTWRVFLYSPAKCVVGWQTYKVGFFLQCCHWCMD